MRLMNDVDEYSLSVVETVPVVSIVILHGSVFADDMLV